MKNINTMKFIVEYTKQMITTIDQIEKAETYDEAKRIGNYAMGLVDDMVVFTNTMVCVENNVFTQEMSDIEDYWRADIYQAVGNVAIRTKQPTDEIVSQFKRRDECRS